MRFLGIDIGSSSVKVSVLDGDSGNCLDGVSYPENELTIDAPRAGWAEQDPEMWWNATVNAIHLLLKGKKFKPSDLAGIGIAYQMHGLVAVDKKLQPVRPSIIWCDSRAVENGNELFNKAGKEKCITHLLNSPGNFTLSKLHWLKMNEPETYGRIYKIMLPGDYIAMRMTGQVYTTISGLSEGIMWDFKENGLANFIVEAAGVDPNLIPDTVPTFGLQGKLSKIVSELLHLPSGIPIAYRAGDQPNNAFSLNVLNPGETAATAGTSGVIYGVTDKFQSDPLCRVSSFAHVNYKPDDPRLGILLCINGTGIANSWIKNTLGAESYERMNKQAGEIPIGSEELYFMPFGNGAERMLQNQEIGASYAGLNFNIHRQAHLQRAVQEGIAFAFYYGTKIMKESGVDMKLIRAGHSNMFLSDVFCQTLSTLSGATIELYNTDGSFGAARGAAVGTGFYQNFNEAFETLKRIKVVEPDLSKQGRIRTIYKDWEILLNKKLSSV
ncbi:MAG: carbohydrate kinase [Bacteroidales bacterium]|nr:carbohydrate kinase [Bacteroidales bacterium]